MITQNSSENFSISKNQLFNYVNTFSFPRLAGTEGEKKAVDLVVKTFESIGFQENQIEKQPFEFSNFYSVYLVKIFAILTMIFLIFLLLMKYLYPMFMIGIIILIFIVLFSLNKVLRHPELRGFWEKHFGKTFSATNVFVRIPAKKLSSDKAGNLIISAHLDSKSQTFKTVWRVVISRIWLYGIILLGVLYFLFLSNFHDIIKLIGINLLLIEISIIIMTILIILVNLITFFLNTRNESPGALDNATGMALVFKLSSFFKKNPLENYNLWFCQFSAEELGTMGSRFFVDYHENQFIKGKVFQINCDMVSVIGHKKNRVEYLKSYGILPRKKASPILSRYLHKSAKIEELKVHGFHVSEGAHTDSVPFHLRRYNSIDITTRAAAQYTHNKVDTPDKVDPQILQETFIILRKLILMLDEDFVEDTHKFFFYNNKKIQ